MSAFLVGEAAATSGQLRSLVLVFAASAAAAFLARIGPHLVLPTVVVEIVLGILIGPEVLGWASEGTYIQFLANFGLALLFFFAGLEVVERHVPRQAIARGSLGWAISLALGIAIGYLLQLAGLGADGWLLGIALSTTALGTLVPILSDSGILRHAARPGGARDRRRRGVLADHRDVGVPHRRLRRGRGGRPPVRVRRDRARHGVPRDAGPPAARRRILRETLHSTGQAAVRLSIALLAALVLLANDVGFDFVLGAFAAGLIVGLALDNPEGAIVRMRLEGIGFGLLIPVYFVATGLTFDLDSLLTARGLGLAVLFLLLLLVVRGTPALLWLRELGPRGTGSVAFFGATALPLVVAIVDLGTGRGAIDADVGASLIGAAMVSVLVYPLIATAIIGPEEWSPDVVASAEAEY